LSAKTKQKNKKPELDGKCNPEATNCCATWILSLQPDFQEQKSLIQETIKAAGHLCIFLPKFHCELNFIEFFWGAMKRYLWEHCNYTDRSRHVCNHTTVCIDHIVLHKILIVSSSVVTPVFLTCLLVALHTI
jgi:hypothetical protein